MELFSYSSSKNKSEVQIIFENKSYIGWVYFAKSPRKNKPCRLRFESALSEKLKQTYVMSYMRSIENGLREGITKYSDMKIEEEIPFWEFLDLEFDAETRTFHFTAHYVQKPIFLELFKEIVNSHVLFDIEGILSNKDGIRIAKQDWKSKDELENEIDAKNVVYNLIDVNNKEIYIGEADSLKNRLSGKRSEIPNWTHYRFDSLPNSLSRKERVAIERLIIRTFASFFKNSKGVDTMGVADYQLTNKKIDS